MKEKIAVSGDLLIRQEPWKDSPCSVCSGTPCCKNLPLAAMPLGGQSNFADLVLSSCYDGIYPALKKTGEWTIYLGRNCRHLGEDGKCSIHGSSYQSLVCKSYDAHKCWYTEAFSTEEYSTFVPFDTGMMIWFEQRYGLIKNRFEPEYSWREFCDSAFEYRRNTVKLNSESVEPLLSDRLSFRKSKSDQFLFFPPYKLPENRNHFELLSFRLGFPGICLAVSENCWAFAVKTVLNESRLSMIRREYYPAIGHSDGCYSFQSLVRECRPFSGIGEQWIILRQADLDILKGLTVFDSTGRVRKRPSSRELLDALKSKVPDRAA